MWFWSHQHKCKGVFILAEIDSILEDIGFNSSNFESLIWSHVKRDGNNVTHTLSRLVSYGVEQY